MPEPAAVLGLLSLVYGIHVVLVNLDIALAALIPTLKRIGERREDHFLIERARTLMRYYAGTYAVAGVFGTAFTVTLLAFYPSFVSLMGHIAWVPLGLAAMMIVLRFLTIAGYWYLWDRVSRGLHSAIGIAMAASGFLIPFGFRAVFALLNAPFGLRLKPQPHLIVSEALLSNPTFAPLYLKSVFGALAAGTLVLASAYAWRYFKVGEDLRERYAEIVSRLLSSAGFFLTAMLPLGFWYVISLLAASQYKFINIFGRWLGPGIEPARDYGPLFILKMALVAAQFGVLLYVFQRTLRVGTLDERSLRCIRLAGPAALATVAVGEMLNAYSQLPYFIARPDLFQFMPRQVAEALSAEAVNTLANLPGVYVVTGALLAPLLAAVAVLFYVMLTGEGEEAVQPTGGSGEQIPVPHRADVETNSTK